ncbi:hypothetical protein CHARACLAT_018915 [Characodon lateralis]|uniref:Secreted protein n=1 Tax=Characodon lateralis TaxID=208331 RepID=A0ABU7DKA7_9TELE|nr:hypothetical protein [Characodon lateralis]
MGLGGVCSVVLACDGVAQGLAVPACCVVRSRMRRGVLGTEPVCGACTVWMCFHWTSLVWICPSGKGIHSILCLRSCVKCPGSWLGVALWGDLSLGSQAVHWGKLLTKTNNSSSKFIK